MSSKTLAIAELLRVQQACPTRYSSRAQGFGLAIQRTKCRTLGRRAWGLKFGLPLLGPGSRASVSVQTGSHPNGNANRVHKSHDLAGRKISSPQKSMLPKPPNPTPQNPNPKTPNPQPKDLQVMGPARGSGQLGKRSLVLKGFSR